MVQIMTVHCSAKGRSLMLEERMTFCCVFGKYLGGIMPLEVRDVQAKAEERNAEDLL